MAGSKGQSPLLERVAVEEFLGSEAGFPGRKLGIALVCEVEIVETDLFDKACAVEDVPYFFGDAADHKKAACGFKKIMQRTDCETH